MKGEQLYIEPSYTYLGMWIDENISWNKQMDNICAKISKRLGILQRTKIDLLKETLKMLYSSLVLKLFDYGDLVYNNYGSKLMQRLQRLQNKGSILITGHPYDRHAQRAKMVKCPTKGRPSPFLYGAYMSPVLSTNFFTKCFQSC